MGKRKYIETPEKMWELFLEYVDQEKKNPIKKTHFVGKDGNREEVDCYVQITFDGFELYLSMNGIINDLGDYASNKDGKYSDYSTIITRVRKYCFVNNLKGASVNELNPNLIARYLGISEKSETTIREQPLFGDE